ncbi:MAG: hypothetical protein HKN63_04165 [Rhodobacteraceae bacterium]|nr:hypothetical protein [Paracoccaceae bacterium]
MGRNPFVEQKRDAEGLEPVAIEDAEPAWVELARNARPAPQGELETPITQKSLLGVFGVIWGYGFATELLNRTYDRGTFGEENFYPDLARLVLSEQVFFIQAGFYLLLLMAMIVRSLRRRFLWMVLGFYLGIAGAYSLFLRENPDARRSEAPAAVVQAEIAA